MYFKNVVIIIFSFLSSITITDQVEPLEPKPPTEVTGKAESPESPTAVTEESSAVTEAEPSDPVFRPIVLWHGIGDSCCDPESVGGVKDYLEIELYGVYVLSIMIGFSIYQDEKNSVIMGANAQVREVCRKLKKDPKLADGYNAVGFSQGAQFLRAVAERCPYPRIYNLISMGGQHQGVFRLMDDKFSNFAQNHDFILYTWFARRFLAVAGYWHDPLKEEKYRKTNQFLADINNERIHKRSEEYKQNLLKLENLVLVKYGRDSIVVPRETQWFGYYTPGQAAEITPLQESPLWTEDRIGLRELSDTGRLHFIEFEDGEHLEFDGVWFYNNILKFLV